MPLEYANLDRFFYPRSVVVVSCGSRGDSAADNVMATLRQEYSRGTLGRARLPALDLAGVSEADRAILEKCDLAVIVAAAEQQAELACLCDDLGARTALLLTDLRAEETAPLMPHGYQRLSSRCEHGLRVLGPQSFGLISPHHKLNASFGQSMPRAGSIAFISESSAMASAVLDWSLRTGVGFSAMAACDAMPDVAWADLLTHFGDDPQTRSIVIYLETIGDARRFLSAAREVALSKPIILLKSKQLGPGSEDDASADAVMDAALRRVGVLRVRSVSELFYMAHILAQQPLPRGPRLAIITNSKAPAMLAADSLQASGGELAMAPVNLGGAATANDYASAISAAAADPDVNGLLVILTPQPAADPTATARTIAEMPARAGKPLLASWMGGDSVAAGQDRLFRSSIPAFPYPDTPARLFALMWRHAQNLNAIYETPTVIVDEESSPVDAGAAEVLLEQIRAGGAIELQPRAAVQLLQLYGIPVHGEAHPPDDAYKLRVASGVNPIFGPYMLFGIGGRMSAIYGDFGLALPPLTSALALRLMELSAVWRVLKPTARNEEPNRKIFDENGIVPRLQALLVRLSQLIVQQPSIAELIIDPLYVSGDAVVITGAQIRLHPATMADVDLPRPAIRPYPIQYTWHETARGGLPLIIRPVRPEDEPLIVNFHRLLSEETIYRRYFFQHKFSRRTSHERLRRTCFLDFDREIALAALVPLEDGSQGIAAVGRLARSRTGESAEIAMVVADPYQAKGIGTMILRHLVDIARAEGVRRLQGTMLPGNMHMQNLFGKLGFTVGPGPDDTAVAELVLPASA